MPCDTVPREVREQRLREQQMRELERALKAKAMKIAVANGRVTIEGWINRSEWQDGCALRALMHSADFEVRRIAASAIPAAVQMQVFGHVH